MNEVATINAVESEVIEALENDPYLGYTTLDEALDDCRATSQVEALARLLSGENVFASGPAGSGKTSVVTLFERILRRENPNIVVDMTAFTGVAANLIGGSTLHRWGGRPESDFIPDQNYENMRNVDVLVIDEVSMVPAYMFEAIDAKMRRVRRKDEPFGGVQLVLLGDFMQLPPVKGKDPDLNYDYCILTDSWKNSNIKMLYMDKVHRAVDPDLQNVLSSIAKGEVGDDVRALVETRRGENARAEGKTYVNLFTTNKRIDSYNAEQLAKVKKPEHKFELITEVTDEKYRKDVESTIKNANVQDELVVKETCPVILTKNLYINENELIPNGSIGRVKNIANGFITVEFNDGRTIPISRNVEEVKRKSTVVVKGKKIKRENKIGSFSQIPLKIGYAISVHKSQGQTYDGVVADLGRSFMPGLGYVALSRVRSLQDLVIKNMDSNALEVGERSLRIATAIKKHAMRNRKDFESNREKYEEMLTSPDVRNAVRNTDEVDKIAEYLEI